MHHTMLSKSGLSRRTALLALVATGLGLAHHPQRMVAQERRNSLPLVLGPTYVGLTSDLTTMIALVLGDPAGDGTRPAQAYVCDGPAQRSDTWFSGTLAADQLRLTADDGSQLVGTHTAAGIAGGVTLRDGRQQLFTAPPAVDAAGFYRVAVLADGQLDGHSAAQSVLEGELLSAAPPDEYLPSLDTPSEGQIMGLPGVSAGQSDFLYAVHLTTPEGQQVPLQLQTATREEGVFSLIVLPDGHGCGQGTATATGAWIDAQLRPTR